MPDKDKRCTGDRNRQEHQRSEQARRRRAARPLLLSTPGIAGKPAAASRGAPVAVACPQVAVPGGCGHRQHPLLPPRHPPVAPKPAPALRPKPPASACFCSRSASSHRPRTRIQARGPVRPLRWQNPVCFDELLGDPSGFLTGAGGLLSPCWLGFAFYRMSPAQAKNVRTGGQLLPGKPSAARLLLRCQRWAARGHRQQREWPPAPIRPWSIPPANWTLADDVDPVAEADVYLAYGRDLQAEEILKRSRAHQSGPDWLYTPSCWRFLPSAAMPKTSKPAAIQAFQLARRQCQPGLDPYLRDGHGLSTRATPCTNRAAHLTHSGCGTTALPLQAIPAFGNSTMAAVRCVPIQADIRIRRRSGSGSWTSRWTNRNPPAPSATWARTTSPRSNLRAEETIKMPAMPGSRCTCCRWSMDMDFEMPAEEPTPAPPVHTAAPVLHEEPSALPEISLSMDGLSMSRHPWCTRPLPEFQRDVSPMPVATAPAQH